MRIAFTILLSLTILALGTGAAEYLHNLQHAHEDAALAKADADAGRPAHAPPVHDESNCAVHAQLHAPFTGAAWLPILVCLGLFVAFLSEIAHALISQTLAFNLACRGPPVC